MVTSDDQVLEQKGLARVKVAISGSISSEQTFSGRVSTWVEEKVGLLGSDESRLRRFNRRQEWCLLLTRAQKASESSCSASSLGT
jgi:hypothetical protein